NCSKRRAIENIAKRQSGHSITSAVGSLPNSALGPTFEIRPREAGSIRVLLHSWPNGVTERRVSLFRDYVHTKFSTKTITNPRRSSPFKPHTMRPRRHCARRLETTLFATDWRATRRYFFMQNGYSEIGSGNNPISLTRSRTRGFAITRREKRHGHAERARAKRWGLCWVFRA